MNGKGKDTAVDSATRKLGELDASIKAMIAKASSLSAGIKAQGDENAANTESLNSAAELRAKERAEFQADDKELLLSVDSLKNAIVILGRTHTSFLEGAHVQASSFVEARRSVKRVMEAPLSDDLINQILNPTDKVLVQQFVQAGIGAPEYASHAGEIVGVLKQMKENFEKNMSESTAEENKAQSGFDALKSAKTEEINSGVALVKSKSQSLAKTNMQLSEAKEDHDDTTSSLTADQKFLVDLRQRCAAADKEWGERSQTRTLEIQAVSEAISILASDDSADTFARTVNTFVQVRDESHFASFARQTAKSILVKQASKSHSSALLAIASRVQLDGMEKVTELIDKMVADLKVQQSDEVKHNDFCKEEFHQNDLAQRTEANTLEDLEANINDLESTIDTLASEIKAVDGSIADMQLQMQRANENRVSENKEFQNVVADQRATQVILKKALDRLNKFYAANALIQSKKTAGPPPPAGFSAYKKNSGAGGVTGMIQEIITDAANMEAEAIKSEQDSEDAYVSFVANTQAGVAAAMGAKIDKAEAKATAAKSKAQRTADKDASNDQAKSLMDYSSQLHASCDFVQQNFDARQDARAQEMEALQGAIAALKTA